MRQIKTQRHSGSSFSFPTLYHTLGLFILATLLTACGGGGGSSDVNINTVSAQGDTTAPVITIIGDNPYYLVIDTPFTDPGATAQDNIDGNVTSLMSTTDNVNSNVLGAYTVTYTVTDSAGNTANAIRTVQVIASPAPVITILGENPTTILEGEVYSDAGATATDAPDGDLTSQIITTNPVNTSIVGRYNVTYQVTDSDNTTITKTRLVVVRRIMPIPDTGITWAAYYSTGNNTDCNDGETLLQQDCKQGRDFFNDPKVGAGAAAFDFTKLDSNGNALDAGASSWSCVKDNHTGLIWEVKTNTAQGTDLHSKNDSYNWYSTDSYTNGGHEGYADNDGAICSGYNVYNSASYCNTEAFVNRVNAAGLCGASDWRVPTIVELNSIVHYGISAPTIDSDYFPNTLLQSYTSATSDRFNSSSFSWGTNFSTGLSSNSLPRFFSYPVRLVRTAP